MRKPRVLVLRAAGTNCDTETAFAFKFCGAEPNLIHINRLLSKKNSLDKYQVLVLPGGFTYGDDVAAGKILANELKFKLIEKIKKFIEDGKLIIGICNGFQILVKAGILPGNRIFKQEATLTINDSGKFEDRWTYLRVSRIEYQVSRCIWTKDFPDIIYLPVAHGEGKFVFGSKEVLERLKKNEQIIFRYCDKKGEARGYPYNPNGSQDNIAGICDDTGRILGLMPHPERHIQFTQNPHWARLSSRKEPDGIKIFQNAVDYARKAL